MRFVSIVAVGGVVLSAAAYAQHAGHHKPYLGMESRAIKALSAQQTAELREGKGMGLALAAELNGYPGPAHVLEHSDALQLTGQQRHDVQEQFRAMQTEARAIGARLIALEAGLDWLFSHRQVTPENLQQAIREIGVTQAELREAHLKYHLLTTRVLSPEQAQRYAELRGYR